MLNDKLVKFCDDNFDDGKLILTKLYEYKKILIKENQNMNLIGKSTLIDLDERHLLDCIQIVKYLPQHEKSVMDIGTGAGLPGIILSIIGFKNLHLVEKSPKKSFFLENCKLRLGLNYVVHNKSISEISNLNVDCITARAFASIEKIILMTKKIMLINNEKYHGFTIHKVSSELDEGKTISNKTKKINTKNESELLKKHKILEHQFVYKQLVNYLLN